MIATTPARVLGTLVITVAALAGPTAAMGAPAPNPAAAAPVIKNCLSENTVKPKTIDLACADANSRLVGITWEAWTTEVAIGDGTYEENTCTPDCARGTQVRRSVGITAHTPVGTGVDRRFSKVTFGASGGWGNTFRDAELPR